MPNFDFADQVVMISGADGNLGEAAVRGFAPTGARLVLIGRQYESLEATFPELAENERVLFVTADLTDANAVQGMAHEAIATHGRIDVLLNIAGAFFNADSAFDTKAARKTCFNHELVPNIPENKRNRKAAKRGRKRLFNAKVYKRRFTAERSFAWVDKFKRLLIRFERKDVYWLGGHFIAFAMINLRHILA